MLSPRAQTARVLAARFLTGCALACVIAGAPAYASAAPNAPMPAAVQGPTLTLQSERPSYLVGETVGLTGILTDDAGRGLPGALVLVTVDHDSAQPLTATTDAQGAWRLDVPAQPSWHTGVIGVTAGQVAAPDAPSAAPQSTTFTVTDPGTPVVLTAATAVPGPINQGQEVELTGTLHTADNRPAAGQSVYVTLAGSSDAVAFASTDAEGRWATTVRVPDDAGAGSADFPAYAVTVHFDGDTSPRYDAPTAGLAPAQASVALTLAGPPVTRVVAPTPVPSPTLAPSPTAAAAAQRPAAPRPMAASAALTGYVSMPSITSPGVLLGGAGIVATVMGAALLSHASRVRHG